MKWVSLFMALLIVSCSHNRDFLTAVKNGNIGKLEDLLDGQEDALSRRYPASVMVGGESMQVEWSLCRLSSHWKQQAVFDFIIGRLEPGDAVLNSDVDGLGGILIQEARYGNCGNISKLLKKGVDLNQATATGQRALHIAARYGHLPVVKLLHEKGANLNQASNAAKWTPLHLAVLFQHSHIVRYLLKENVAINVENAIGSTPLHIACEKNDDLTIKLLLKNGAEVNLVDSNDQTPLMLAVKGGCNLETYKTLRDKGASESPKGVILNCAVHRKDIEFAKLLVKDGYSVNKVDPNRLSPLYFAISLHEKKMVTYLLEQGAQLFSPPLKEPNWFMLCLETEQQDLISTLLDTRQKRGELYWVEGDAQALEYANKLRKDKWVRHLSKCKDSRVRR